MHSAGSGCDAGRALSRAPIAHAVFEVDADGQLSMLDYRFKNHRLFLTHTEVPPALEGHGLGTKSAHAALEYARQNDLPVIAICPFVQEYVAGHPEYQSFVTTSVA